MFFKKVTGNIPRCAGGGRRRSAQRYCFLSSCHRSLHGEAMCSWSTWSLSMCWCWCSRDASPTGSTWPIALSTAWAPFFPCRSPLWVSRWALGWVGFLASTCSNQLHLNWFILDFGEESKTYSQVSPWMLVLTEVTESLVIKLSFQEFINICSMKFVNLA